jgi:hypothetical protein
LVVDGLVMMRRIVMRAPSETKPAEMVYAESVDGEDGLLEPVFEKIAETRTPRGLSSKLDATVN